MWASQEAPARQWNFYPARRFIAARKIDIARCQAAGVVGGQHHLDGLVDVEPLRMVVHLLRDQRRPRHEAEGFVEVPEGKSFGDGVAATDLGPALKPCQRLRPRAAAQSFHHHRLLYSRCGLARMTGRAATVEQQH